MEFQKTDKQGAEAFFPYLKQDDPMGAVRKNLENILDVVSGKHPAPMANRIMPITKTLESVTKKFEEFKADLTEVSDMLNPNNMRVHDAYQGQIAWLRFLRHKFETPKDTSFGKKKPPNTTLSAGGLTEESEIKGWMAITGDRKTAERYVLQDKLRANLTPEIRASVNATTAKLKPLE